MFKFFENLTQAFPERELSQPPNNLLSFCRYYTKGFEKVLIAMTLLSVTIAIIEVSLFNFMGQLVDWLSNSDPKTFIEQNSITLMSMAFLIVIVMPILIGIYSLIIHQSMLGNYPMSIRWLAHRYLLKQSVNFYQNDFAGRIATKVMQTALAVREAVMKTLDVFVYVTVYFITILIILAQADWRLMLPMAIWLIAYVSIQFYFVPKLRNISSKQADARSLMTGRLVDSYTNISTVKLFSHSSRETTYAKEGMNGFLGTVHHQMRLVTGLGFK